MALSLWTGALLIRVFYLRYIAKRVSGEGAQHWTTHLALTIGVFAIGAFRLPRLHQPPDAHLYVASFLLLLVTYGVTRKFKPALRRRPR